jgi:hypothetical protein
VLSLAVTLPLPLAKLVLKLSCHFAALLARCLYKRNLANSLDFLVVLADLGMCHRRFLRPRERDSSPLVGII